MPGIIQKTDNHERILFTHNPIFKTHEYQVEIPEHVTEKLVGMTAGEWLLLDLNDVRRFAWMRKYYNIHIRATIDIAGDVTYKAVSMTEPEYEPSEEEEETGNSSNETQE